jgi:hypothetical protein
MYTLIVSPGYYLQNRAPAFVAMFAALFALALFAVIVQMKRVLARSE